MKTLSMTTVVNKFVIDAKSKVRLRHWDDRLLPFSVQTNEADKSWADLWNVQR